MFREEAIFFYLLSNVIVPESLCYRFGLERVGLMTDTSMKSATVRNPEPRLR